jgi:hypothetical protein
MACARKREADISRSVEACRGLQLGRYLAADHREFEIAIEKKEHWPGLGERSRDGYNPSVDLISFARSRTLSSMVESPAGIEPDAGVRLAGAAARMEDIQRSASGGSR